MKDVRFQRTARFLECSLAVCAMQRQPAKRQHDIRPEPLRWQKYRQPVGDLEQWGQRAYKMPDKLPKRLSGNRFKRLKRPYIAKLGDAVHCGQN